VVRWRIGGIDLNRIPLSPQSTSVPGVAIEGRGAHRGKPFLRWAGSKRKQLSRLASFWLANHQRYVEPFAGSACLFFELAPETALLGDINKELIETYRVVRDEPERLFTRLCRIERNLATYRRWRQLKPSALDSETRAVRFLYLNRNCFNGIYRTNLKGEFNVPMGTRVGKYLNKEDLLNCSALLQRATLIAGDFARTIERVKKGDFVYLDPPYAVAARRIFREYGKKTFGTSDISRLSEALTTIVQQNADFLVSYADCTEARALALSWHSVRLPVRRHVAGFVGDRKAAYEWLISNRPIALDEHAKLEKEGRQVMQ
jgi:DNA adenine methylase